MKVFRFGLVAVCAIPVFGQAATYTKTLTFNDPDGMYTYSGQADFTQVGSNLIVVLTNIADTAANKQRRVLTGVFFDLEGDPSVTKNSAAYTAGSVQVNGGDSAANVGKHWAFKQNLAANQWGNANYGISAVGLGYFGPSDTFMAGGGSPNGTDYGLVPTAGTSLITPYGKNSVTFSLNLPVGYSFTDDKLSNVWFQYGSNTNEFFFNVPEPTSMAALALGAVALLSRRRRQKN